MAEDLRVVVDADAGPLRRELGAAGTSVKVFGKEVDSQSRGVRAFGAALDKQKSSLRELGTAAKYGAVGVAAAGAYVIGQVIKTGAAFEQQMARVQGVSSATEKQMGSLRRLAIKLGADTKFSAGEAAEAMYELSSAGFKVGEMSKALPGVLSLAAASGVDLASAAEISSNALRGFGLEASESGHVADVLAQAVNSSSVEMEDLQLSLKYIGPVARATGEGFDEMIAAVSLMGDAGIKGEQAGTSIRGGLLRLVDPTKQVNEGMEKLRLETQDLYGPRGLLPLPQLVGKLKEGMAGLDQSTKAQALSQIFGKEALSGMLTVVEAGPAKLRRLSDEFDHSGGAAKKAATTMNDTVAGAFDELKGSAETAEIELYELFSDPLKEGLREATQIVNDQEKELQQSLKEAMAAPEFDRADIGRKAEIIVGVFGEQWKKSGFQQDIREGLVDAFDWALPKVAEAMGKGALTAADTFAKGFMESDALGKLVIGTWLFAKFGGFAALRAAGARAGTEVGIGMQQAITAESTAATATPATVVAAGARSRAARGPSMASSYRAAVARNAATAAPVVEPQIKPEQGKSSGLTWGKSFLKGFGLSIIAGGGIAGALAPANSPSHRVQNAFSGASFGIIPGAGPSLGGHLAGMTEGLTDDAFKDLPSKSLPALKKLQTEMRSAIKMGIENGADDAELKGLRQRLAAAGGAVKLRVDFQSGLKDLNSGVVTRMKDIRKVFDQNVGAINGSWRHGSDDWRKATVQNMQGMVAAIQAGMRQGVIKTGQGKKEIQAVLRDIKLVEGSDPLGIAGGFASSWKRAGDVNRKELARVKGDLQKMPKDAREVAINAMVGMARNLESKGQLVKGATARLTSTIATKFGSTNKQVEQSTAAAMSNLAKSSSEGATNVGGALSNIFDNLANALAAVGASKIPTFSLSTLSTASQYHHTREQESGLGRQSGGIVPGSGDGDQVKRRVPAGTFILNREATRAFGYGFQRGGEVAVELEPGEREFSPREVRKVGLRNLQAMNAAVPRFGYQAGGEVMTKLPHPQLGGPEPTKALGQKAIDTAYGPAQKYLREHLEPARILKALRWAEATAAKGLPYTYSGGHGALGVGSPGLDCSGFVSGILGAAGFIGSPMSVQQGSGLYTLGAAGPGKWLTWGVRGTSGMSAHTMAAIKAPGNVWKYFESGGSGGGPHEDGGWDGSFSFRHMPGFQKGGMVGAREAVAAGGSGVAAARMPAKAREAIASFGRDAFDPHSKRFVGWGFQKGGYTGDINHLWAEHEAPDWGGPKLPAYVIAALAEAAGAPGVTMEQVTRGESSGRPGSSGTDEAPTNGHTTKGWGLWAITSGVGNDSLVSPYGGYEQMLNPVKNAAVMAVMYSKSGLTPWHGDEFVTGDGQHYTGNYDIRNALGGKSYKQALTGKGGDEESDEHTFKEDVPARYGGCLTGSIDFGSMPDSLRGVERELHKRRTELPRYRQAAQKARKAKRPAIAEALRHNITAIETRIEQLEHERAKLRREVAKKKVTRRLQKALAKITGAESLVEAAHKIYEHRNTFAQQLVEQEPVEGPAPDFVPLPRPNVKGMKKEQREAALKDWEHRNLDAENAFNVGRRSAEQAFERGLIDYVEGRERPAYGAVLGAEADWRNAILKGESLAAGNWQTGTVGGMEGGFENRIAQLRANIASISALPDQHKTGWWHDHPKALKTLHELLSKLPLMRFKEKEMSDALTSVREAFYPGNAQVRDPKPPLAGSGTFEENLADVQGSYWPGLHDPMKKLPAVPSAGAFGGAIWDTQEAIKDLGLKVAETAAQINVAADQNEWDEEESEGGEAPDTSAWTAAKEALSLQAQQNFALSQGEVATIGQFFRELGPGLPYLGAFAQGTGGKRVGRTGWAVLHEDEMVTPTPKGAFASQLAAPAGASHQVDVHLHGSAEPFLNKVEVMVDGKLAKVDQQLGADARRRRLAPGR